MVQKSDELSWFERMTKELENDPEYLREYIMLCSDEIKCQGDKITTLKRELKESAEEMLRIISDIKYIKGIVERGTGGPIGDDIPVAGAILEYVKSLERERDELKKSNEYWEDQASSYEVQLEGALRERDELKEENETLRCHAHDAELAFDRYGELEAENATLRKEREELKEAMTAVSRETVMWIDAVAELKEENATLRKRLEPIEEWWDRNCSEYIRKKHQKWDASMYEAIEKAMELKEG